MTQLLSDAELGALRVLVRSGMQKQTVTIRRLTTVEGDLGDVSQYTTIATVDGWIREITTQSASIGEAGGVQSMVETHRLFVPVGTDLRSGDLVIVAGIAFRVQHTDEGSDYLTHLTAILRRRD